jgi:hypothetical protein
MLAAAGGMAVIYTYSEAISLRVPGVAPSIAVFTGRVDADRVWLDGAAVRATKAIQGLTDG